MAQAVNTTKHLIAPHDARAYLAVVDCPAFLQAVADGSCSAVEEFHNDGVGRLNKVIPNCFDEKCIDAWGDGPVHWAVRKGRVDVLRKLISRGWFVDEMGRHNDTPLCIASEQESPAILECINMLCIAGVRSEYGGSSRVSPLLRAVSLNLVQTAKALLIGGASLTTLHPESFKTAIQIASSDEMRELLTNPPDVSPWNSTGLFKPPQTKKKAKSSAAWSSRHVTINRSNVSADSSAIGAPTMTEEEKEAAYRAARAEARANRRAAVQAEANLGLDMCEIADIQDRLQVLDKSAVARMASIIQVNVKKETPACTDDASSTARHGTFPESNGNDEKESIPMAAASIETWGGLTMRCSEAGSSVYASDFGFDAEATVIVEGRLPSTKDIPASAVQGIEESQRLAELQRTISSWMERRRSKDANDDPPSGDEFKQHDHSRDMYLHRMTCSKQLALELTSELLGDNCDDETDPNKSMCFVLQWQMHISRIFLRQDGSSITMPPLISSSDASLLRNITIGPGPTLAEQRAMANAANGAPVVHCFKHCDAEQWLVADAFNEKAMKVTAECSNPSVETVVLGCSTCLLDHLQCLQGLVAVRAQGKVIETLLMQSSLLNDDETPIGIKHTVWKAMKPLQFKVCISSRAILPNTLLRMFGCRAAPVTADEFPEDVPDSSSDWPLLQEDYSALRVIWSESISVMPHERHSESTGDFDWPTLPNPHVVMSQVAFGTVNLGVQDVGSELSSRAQRRMILRPDVTEWRWRQVDMSHEEAPPWSPVDTREDSLSAIEIEEGVNVTSMINDEIECPFVCDTVWHTRTCEKDGAALTTAHAAAQALSNALTKGHSAEDAFAEFKAVQSSCDDLKFSRWASCYFMNTCDGARVPYKLPMNFVSQANDIPHETTVLGQYRVGAVLPISASEAVRIFNLVCHVGPSMCLEPCVPIKPCIGLTFSNSVLNPMNADGGCAHRAFLEFGPDPNKVRMLKLLQTELSELEIELMDVVSLRAFKERGSTGDRELSWDSVNAYMSVARHKESELRARIAKNASESKFRHCKTPEKFCGHSQAEDLSSIDSLVGDIQQRVNSHLYNLQDELVKEFASIQRIILLDDKVNEVRQKVYRMSEVASQQHVIIWSRWSQNACAHTPPEPPFVDIPYSDAISCLVQLHGAPKSPLQPQQIFELPHIPKPIHVDPRLLEKTVSSKCKERPPRVVSIKPDPPTRDARRCISPGPLDRVLDVHLSSSDDAAEAKRLQNAAFLSDELNIYTVPAVLKEAQHNSEIKSHLPLSSAAVASRATTSQTRHTEQQTPQFGGSSYRSVSAASGLKRNAPALATQDHQVGAGGKASVPVEKNR